MWKLIFKLFILFCFIHPSSDIYCQVTNIHYIYDDINRLIQTTYPNGAIIQYKYDKVGNREEHMITGNASLPDLTIVNQMGSPTSVGQGGVISVSGLLQNAGQLAAGVNKTKIYINASPVIAGATLLDSILHNGVPSGGTSLAKSVTIPVSTSTGSKYILLVADANSQVTESNENNNIASFPITVTACTGITATIGNVVNASCNLSNGSASVSPGGGNTYTYSWNTIPGQTNATAINLPSGSYTVTVTAQNGCTATAVASIINSGNPPLANYTVTSPSQNVIQFNNTSTNAPTSYSWNFGDGFTSTLTSPSHTYAQPGTYNVCLTANNGCGSDIKCQNVQVSNGCLIPYDLNASNISTDSVNLFWSGQADSFRLEYKALTATTWIAISNITSNYKILKNLQEGTAYHFKVKAFCGNMSSSFSDPVIFYTQSISYGNGFIKKLDFPTDLQSVRNHCVKTSDGFIVTAVSEAISRNVYLIKFDQDGNKIWSKILNVDATTTNQQGLTDLTALTNGGVAYIVRSGSKRYLAKVDGNGNTSWIKELTIGTASNYFIINTDAGLNDEVLISGWCRLGNSTTPLMGFIYRISATGSIIWKKAYEVPGSEVWIYSVKPISGGNFTFTGFVKDIATTHSDVLYARINSSGNVLASSGIYTAIDRFESFDHITVENAGSNNGSYLNCGLYGGLQTVLLKYVEGTGVVWANSFDTFIPSGLNIDGASNLYFNSSSGEVIKTNPNGSTLWAKKLNSTAYNLFTRKLAILNNNLFMSGGSGVDQYLIKADTSGSAPQCITSTIGSGEAVLPLTVSSVTMTSVDVTPFTYTDITVASQNANPLIGAECPCTTQAGFTTSAPTYCASDSIMFVSSSTNAISFKWYLNTLNSSPISQQASFKYAFNSSGSFNVYLVAENGYCKDTFQNSIVINPKPVITFQNIVNPTCSASNNGSISSTITVGTSPYQFLWSNSATTMNITNLTQGSYTLTVTDFKGCISTKTATLVPSTSPPTLSVSIPATVTISSQVYQNPNCNGSNICNWYYNATSTNATACSTTNLSNVPNGSFSNVTCNAGLTSVSTTPGTYYFKYKASNTCGEALFESIITVLSCKKYLDADGDGFGHQSTFILDCAGTPSGYVNNNLDCNDNCSNCYPNAPEVCDNLDNNCNGSADEGCLCMPPSSINVNNITPSSANINWIAVGNAQNYTLSYRAVNTTVWQVISGISTNNNVLNGLMANTPYELLINSVCGNSTSVVSDTVNFTTSELCATVFGLSAVPLTNSVNLQWTPSSYALSYSIDYKIDSVTNWTSYSNNYAGSILTIAGLKGGTKYNVRIRCNCANSTQSIYASVDFITAILSTNNIILSDSTLFGISRAELYNNEIHVIAATNPQLNSVPGYPDPNTWYRTKLISESNNNLLPLESASVSTDMTHHNLRVNNSNQLAIVYQAPTGNGYNFRMPYKIWNGASLVANENVFPNNNNGAIPVIEFNTSNVPTIVSFAHAGYALLSYKKPATSWIMTPVTANGTYYSSTRSINKQDTMVVIDKNHSTGTLHIHKNHMAATTWIPQNTGIQVDFNCDLELSNSGGLAMLYNKNNVVIANINGVAENVISLGGIDHRADLIFDENNFIYVAYQTINKVGVLKKSGGTWNEIFSHNVSINSSKANLTKITLIKKPTGISVVYADNYNVYVSLINTIMLGIDETNQISLKYYSPINSSTVNNQNIKVYGSHTGLKSCTFNVMNDLVVISATPGFMAGEQIHVTSSSSVLSSTGIAFNANNWLLNAKSTNLTNGHFIPVSTGITLPTNATAYSYDCSMADMNKDGKMDIVYRYHSAYGAATNVLIYLRNTNNTFLSPISYSTPNSHSSLVGTPDLNGDGYPDVVLNFNVPSAVQVWLNNGVGGLNTPTSYTVSSFSNGAKILDADKDGDLDIMSFSGVSTISANALSVSIRPTTYL